MKPATLIQVAPSKWDGADQAYERGQQAYLDWCREIAKLYAEGDATQEEIAGRYDTDQSRVARSVAIGRDQRIITLSNTVLPKDRRALYELTTLDDEDFEELCKPTTTQAVILEHKRRLSAPTKPQPVKVLIEPTKPTRPPCPGVEGSEPGQYVWDPVRSPEEGWLQHVDVSTYRCNQRQVSHGPTRGESETWLRRELQEFLDVSNPTTIKLVKSLFSSAYHPDSGRVEKNGQYLAAVNSHIDNLYKEN